MRTKTSGIVQSIGRMLCAGTLLGAVAGCQMMKPYDADGGGAGRPPVLPASAIGALVFGPEGEIYVVDAQGKPVEGCVLAGTMAARARECHGLAGTTVMSIKSAAFVRHTGSTCTTIGPIIHAGAAYYFQLPAGCTR